MVNAGYAVGISCGSSVEGDFDAEALPVLGKETDSFDAQRRIAGVAGKPTDKDHLDPSRRNPVGPGFLQRRNAAERAAHSAGGGSPQVRVFDNQGFDG